VKLGVIAHDLTQPAVRGLSRYTAGLVNALAATGGADIVLFARAPLAESYRNLPGERCIWPGAREVSWEQWDLPRKAAAHGVQILHAPSNRGLCAFAHCPTVVTRHDEIERLFPPDFPGSLRSRFRMRYSDEISIRRADAVATISETSRRDILATWRLPEERVVVTSEGIDDRFFGQISDREMQRVAGKYNLTSPYIFYLGGLDKRKDVVTLVEAYAAWNRPDVRCVIAGPTRGELAEVKRRITAYGLNEARVALLGEVDDHDVPALYAGASCFVYPSRYEGFGLQAIEAMAMGVPVIASDGGALPEVVGDAGLLFPVGDAQTLAGRLAMLSDDANLRAHLVGRGRTRAEDFRWEKVVPNYLDLYRHLCGRSSTVSAASRIPQSPASSPHPLDPPSPQ